MIKVFDLKSEYNVFTDNGTKLQSGDIYFVSEDSSYHFFTNNIDGKETVIDTTVGGVTPSGNLDISTNGSNIDVAQYATVAVSVPASAVVSGTLSITSNASNINVTEYANVDVNVAIPDGYVLPSGTLNITSNGSNIDVAQYATVDVSVAGSAQNETILYIGFRNTTDSYGISQLIGTDLVSSNIFFGNVDLGTVDVSSPSHANNSGSGYLQPDGSISKTPSNSFLNERKVTWIKLNGEKTHTFSTLPETSIISLTITAWDKGGVSAPIMGEASITLPSNIENKECILIYDFDPSASSYFTLNQGDSFII